jgi:hypothetical protein
MTVMRGLDPRIHLQNELPFGMLDGRVKPGHDSGRM